MTVEQEVTFPSGPGAVQIGNYHYWKLEPLRLMNRHQLHGVGGVVELSFTFTTANRLEVVNVFDEVANQMSTGAFEALRQAKKFFDVSEPLSTIVGRCNHSGIGRSIYRVTQQIADRITIAAIKECRE